VDELELGYLLAISAAALWSPRPLVAMLSHFGSAKAVVEYVKSGHVSMSLPCEVVAAEALARIAAIRDDDTRRALADASVGDQAVVTRADQLYPAQLCDLCDAPPVLYYRGTLTELGNRVVALVGSRAATPYGRSMTATIVADFAAYGATIVSGLARGIDAAAHRAAIGAGLPTVAVIGSGLRALYPPYHLTLANEIVAAGGAVLTEFPPNIAARPHHFPMRNRLVAALGQATFVIEAGTKSGALITAGLAGDLGRPVFALPGDVGRVSSEGTNALIKDGVALATGAADVASVLGWCVAIERSDSVTFESALLGALAPGGSSVDEICVKTGLDSGSVAAQLTILEMQGAVQRYAGGLYTAVRNHKPANLKTG
jgi:DNA processing protein